MIACHVSLRPARSRSRLGALTASSAAAATTRHAASTAPPEASACTNVADPCPLAGALEQAQAGDTISLLVGTYNGCARVRPRWNAPHHCPRQRQVCELAAAGKGNRAIAQELFLSIKTVETHLAAGYRKLGVNTRDDLAAELAS